MYESSFEKKFIKAAEVLYAAEGDRLMQETDVSLKCTGTEILFKKRSRHHVQDFFINKKYILAFCVQNVSYNSVFVSVLNRHASTCHTRLNVDSSITVTMD